MRRRNERSKDWLDPVEFKPNDVFLSMTKDLDYKALMFAQFKKLGRGSKVDEAAANKVLDTLKKRGGRIFRLSRGGAQYEEADDEASLKGMLALCTCTFHN